MPLHLFSLMRDYSDLFFAVAVAALTIFLMSRARGLPLPPGPKASWWFGTVRLPEILPWLTVAKWRETYGTQFLKGLEMIPSSTQFHRGHHLHLTSRKLHSLRQFGQGRIRPTRQAKC